MLALGSGQRREELALPLVKYPDRYRLYGAPATRRSYEASFFDFVRVDEGRIIERVQQADVLGQMRQLYGKGLGTIGLAAMFWRL